MRVDVHFVEVAQAVRTVARKADLVAVVPGRFKLAELAAHDFVARAVVAGHVHAPHIGAAGQIRLDHKGHAVVAAVDLGHRFDARKRKSEGAEVVGEGLGGFRHLVGVVGFARLNLHQGLELFFLVEVVAFSLTPDTDKRSPSLTLMVMAMLCLSGEIATWVDSTLNSR